MKHHFEQWGVTYAVLTTLTIVFLRGQDYTGAWLRRAVTVAQYTVIDPAHVPLFVEELVPTDRLHRITSDYHAAFALIRRLHTI